MIVDTWDYLESVGKKASSIVVVELPDGRSFKITGLAIKSNYRTWEDWTDEIGRWHIRYYHLSDKVVVDDTWERQKYTLEN